MVLIFGVSAYKYDQPATVEPHPDWDATMTSPKIQHEHFFIQSGSIELEADLLIPLGGSEKKPVAIFLPGSGNSNYQNYADPDLPKRYVQDIFLPRDMAVLFINKRGMGESEGNWMHNDFQGRADDAYAAVEFLSNHPSIDSAKIGLIGHSQGGWIAALTASEHKDVAFFISLAGPTTTVYEQLASSERNLLLCQGLKGSELESGVENKLRMNQLGASLGDIIPIGELVYASGIWDYDPREVLKTVNSPGLLVFGEMDSLVPPDENLARFTEIFNDRSPKHLTAIVVADSNHLFRSVDSICAIYEFALSGMPSIELTEVMHNWLNEQDIGVDGLE